MCPVRRSLRGPQGRLFVSIAGEARTRRLDQQLPAAMTLVPRMDVQAHDVPDAPRIVVGVLGRSELAEPDDILILDQHHDAAASPCPQLAVLGPVAPSGFRDPLAGQRIGYQADVGVGPCLGVDPRQRGRIPRCGRPCLHGGHIRTDHNGTISFSAGSGRRADLAVLWPRPAGREVPFGR